MRLCSPDLAVSETVESEMSVLGDGVRMVDSIDTVGHKNGLLLVSQGLCVVTHNVVQPGKHSKTLSDFWVHRTVPEIERLNLG